jgi:hypothetical protein
LARNITGLARNIFDHQAPPAEIAKPINNNTYINKNIIPE